MPRPNVRAACATMLATILVFALVACAGGASNSSRIVTRLIVGAESVGQYATIWDEQIDNVALASHLRLISSAEDAGLTLVRASSGTAAEAALAALTANDSGVATIIGHNTGGMVRFADGSLLNIADLPEGGARIAVISCSCQEVANAAGAVGIPVDLKLRLALRTEAIFVEKVAALSSDGSTDLRVLQSTLDEAFEEASNEFPTVVTIGLPILVAGSAVVGISISAIEWK